MLLSALCRSPRANFALVAHSVRFVEFDWAIGVRHLIMRGVRVSCRVVTSTKIVSAIGCAQRSMIADTVRTQANQLETSFSRSRRTIAGF